MIVLDSRQRTDWQEARTMADARAQVEMGNFGKKKIGPAVGKETWGFIRRPGFTCKGTITICN